MGSQIVLVRPIARHQFPAVPCHLSSNTVRRRNASDPPRAHLHAVKCADVQTIYCPQQIGSLLLCFVQALHLLFPNSSHKTTKHTAIGEREGKEVAAVDLRSKLNQEGLIKEMSRLVTKWTLQQPFFNTNTNIHTAFDGNLANTTTCGLHSLTCSPSHLNFVKVKHQLKRDTM